MRRVASNPQTQTAPVAGGMPPVIIVADDLTGACDSAAAFLGRAEPVRVLLGPMQSGEQVTPERNTVRAFSTETRNLSGPEAARIVEHVIAAFAVERGSILFKKIDSACRGNLGTETISALQASGAVLALVAPAFPATGRTVVEGVMHIRDSAEQKTSFRLMNVFSGIDAERVELLSAGTVSDLQQGILSALERGTRILLCDAETQEVLVRLATAADRVPQPLLWTGSAGLARALASTFPALNQEGQREQSWREGRTLMFVGTNHSVTQRQLAYVRRQSGVTQDHIHCVQWNETSADSLKAAFARAPVSALILTGGDTAAFVLATLQARAIRVAGELSPGIPWGFIEGGDADGRAVVTKSGGFGQETTLADAFNFCSRRVCEPA
jgi:uncharacterized protein YgbK (DUF1537 family)